MDMAEIKEAGRTMSLEEFEGLYRNFHNLDYRDGYSFTGLFRAMAFERALNKRGASAVVNDVGALEFLEDVKDGYEL